MTVNTEYLEALTDLSSAIREALDNVFGKLDHGDVPVTLAEAALDEYASGNGFVIDKNGFVSRS